MLGTMSRLPANISIVPCPPDFQAACLDLVLMDLPEEARSLSVTSTADCGLFAAFEGRTLVGAILIRPLAGRSAYVWPPRIANEQEALADALLDAADDWCWRESIVLAQALPDRSASLDLDRLSRHGYSRAADLEYLCCAARDFPAGPPDDNLEFVPYGQCEPTRFAAVVEATYQGSLDCPEVDGLREIEEVLASYRATSGFDDSRWYLVRHGDLDAGCLILGDDARANHFELIYMGVAPEARGQGLGMRIVRRAQALARAAGRARLVLSVDAANQPARAIYAAAGFFCWNSRPVFLKWFGDNCRASAR